MRRQAGGTWFGAPQRHKGVIVIDDNKRGFNNNGEIHMSTAGFALGPPGPNDHDGASASFDTLAHELGHSLSHFDEYEETLDNTPLPQFDQPKYHTEDPFRPFGSCGYSMMVANHLPRLRYYWHYLYALHHEDVGGRLGFLRFVAQHQQWPAGALTYKLPPLAIISGEEDVSPWHSIGKRQLTGGSGDLVLYRMGADESASATLYSGIGAPNALSKPVDGALLVRMNFELIAGPGIIPNALQAAATALLNSVRGAANSYHQPFSIDGGGPGTLERVALLLKANFKLTPGEAQAAAPHVRVEIHSATSTAQSSLLLPAASRPSPLIVKTNEVGLSLVRHALGVPTVTTTGTPVLNNFALTPAELQSTGIVAGLKALLQEAPAVPRTVAVPT